MMACSEPLTGWPSRAIVSSGMRRSRWSSASRPSELASRFAGSMVSTSALRPARAAASARAAAVVVLPTPPEPTQMRMRRWAMRLVKLTARTYTAVASRHATGVPCAPMIHRYVATVGERSIEVTVEPAPGDLEGVFRVTVDGRSRLVDARRVEGSAWSLATPDGGPARLVDVDGSGPDYVVGIEGRSVPLKLVE